MTGSAALALSAGTPGAADPVVAVCQNWLRVNAEQYALTLRWQELESIAGCEHNWFKLSEAERHLIPETSEMAAIDESIEALLTKRQDILSRLPDLRAMTLYGVSLKLTVATASMLPDENAEAHALLRSTLNDLTSLMEASSSIQN